MGSSTIQLVLAYLLTYLPGQLCVGQKPEVPGYCVKEKDLEECSTHADCAGVGGGRCVALGRTGERYCLPRSTDGAPEVPVSTATGDLGMPTKWGC